MGATRGTPVQGSRSAHDVTDPDLHASDIEDAAFTVHLDPDAAEGTAMVMGAGGEYVATNIITAAELPHSVLSATHTDTDPDSLVRGDLLVAIGATPLLTRYAWTAPAAGVMRYLGGVAGEAEPTWKDASANPGAAAAILQSAPTTGLLTLAKLLINTNGDDALISTRKGANSDGQNVWIGGGGEGSIGDIADTTKGFGNVAVGYLAGYNITTGQRNVFMGNKAGYEDTTGSYNVFIGLFAGTLNTTGSFNMFLGYGAARTSVDGVYNVAIGHQALHSAISADSNVAIGYQAGYNATGDANTFIGMEAGVDTTTGYRNMFLGEYAGRRNTTGYYNVAIGAYAGYENLVGINNIAIGYQAGLAYKGSESVFIGSYAGTAATGVWNTAVGFNGLVATTTGYLNTALGRYAGSRITTGYSNTFIGASAGTNASQKVDAVNSMALGASTYTTQSNQVIIGNADVSVGLAQTAPIARLTLPAGAAAAGKAPLAFLSGPVLSTAIAGAIEFTTDDFFATITTGAARKAFVLDDGARLTSGKIPIATTNGRLVNLTASSAYTPTNVSSDRSYDANSTTLDEVADVLGTLIADLQAIGVLG